eukprot:4637780-Pyramimonas_sp.AAC.1
MFGVLCATTLRLSPHQVRLGEVVEVSLYSVDSLEQQPAMTLIVVAAIIIHHMNPSSRFRSGADMAQLVCGGCRTLLMYIRGATSVQCSQCNTVNLAMQ